MISDSNDHHDHQKASMGGVSQTMRVTPPKINITKEKNKKIVSSMFKNAQPYMFQFHVKESHIHFWTFFSRKRGGFFSTIWRWFCKHGTAKRGDFVMVDRFYVCFFF